MLIWALLLANLCCPCEGVYEHIRVRPVSFLAQSFSTSAPLLESESSAVTAFAGHSAELVCHVDNAGNKLVSWIRDKDLSVIASGDQVFSSDARLSVHNSNNSWVLRIRQVSKRDQGSFQCQVNSRPKKSRHVTLLVKAKEISIKMDCSEK